MSDVPDTVESRDRFRAFLNCRASPSSRNCFCAHAVEQNRALCTICTPLRRFPGTQGTPARCTNCPQLPEQTINSLSNAG
jgi:hypothetical protein